MRGEARHLPGAARIDAGEAVLALQVGERLRGRDGSPGCERAHRRGELLRLFRLPGEGRPEERIVAPRDEVQRLPRRRRPDDGGLPEKSLERPAPEPVVRVQIPMYGACGDRACIPTRRSITAVGESRAVEEELPRECRAVQFSQREDSFGHGRGTLTRRRSGESGRADRS